MSRTVLWAGSKVANKAANIRACLIKNSYYFGLQSKMLSSAETGPQTWSPEEARHKFRADSPEISKFENSSGMCMQFVQANVAVIPSCLADDFAEFCRLNQAPCPVLYRSKIGEIGAPPLAKDSDIRTDILKYIVTHHDGKQETNSTVDNLMSFPFDDMVTFYLGCSFSFEDAMLKAGIPIQNVMENKNVSMFETKIECLPSGKFTCPQMVVSMRPIKRHLIEKAVTVTAPYESVHGAPIHIGDPDLIGISDLAKADMGGNSHFGDEDVPVFWACGVTSSLAIRSAKSPICFSHSPGCMYISDITTGEYFKACKPSYGNDLPKVVTVQDNPYFASILGTQALDKIDKLEEIIQHDPGNRGIINLHIQHELVKGALRLSHAGSVAIATGFPRFKDQIPPCETDGLPGVISMAKTCKALGKNVTLITSHYNSNLLKDAVEHFSSCGILPKGIEVATFMVPDGKSKEDAANEFLFCDHTHKDPRFDVLVAIEAVCRTSDGTYRTMRGKDLSDICYKSPIDELFVQANKSGKIHCVGIGDGGNEIGMGKVQDQVRRYINNGTVIAATVGADRIITAGVSNWGSWALGMALYLLYECPNHSRYRRHGIGFHQHVTMETAITNVEQERQILEYFVNKGVRDGVTGKAEMSVDGLAFDAVHRKMFEQLIGVCV